MKKIGKIITKNLIPVFIISVLLTSCFNNDRLVTEYYKTGELYRKYIINEKKELDGEYREYYKNGNVKIFTNMSEGYFSDSLSYYNREGLLVAKGLMKKNNLRLGWWRELDSLNGKKVFRDYSIVNDTNYVNQEIYIDDKVDTLYSISRFFRLEFKSKLKPGKNFARMRYFNNSPNSDSDRLLILNNSFEKESDTLLFNKQNICYFPYEYKAGNKELKVKIIESIYFKNDSPDKVKFQVTHYNLLFDLKADKTPFLGESFYYNSTDKLVSPTVINPSPQLL